VVSSEDLARFCATGEERFTEALRCSAEKARATYGELEAARVTTTNRYLAWIALTDEYVLEQHGHQAHRAHTEPERIAELARRSGLGLDDLAQIQALCGSADNPVTKRMAAALSSADSGEAFSAWRESERLLKAAHDLRRDLISDRLGRIYRRFGLTGLNEAMLYAARRGSWRTSMPADFALEPEERLRNLAFFLVVCAYFQVHIVEEAERWIVHVDVCGRCGRQCRDRYYAGDWGLEVVNERSPTTFGREAMTIYQSHAAVIHHIFAIDTVGAPWPVFDCRGLREDPGGCRLYVYRDPTQTPPEFYEQVGRRRPAGLAG
jgi:hypothetical protein